MIYAYGVSLPGTDHIKKGIVCQDAHNIICKGEDIAIAAVADGLGSALYSDIGSRIAADEAVIFCGEKIKSDMKPDDILAIIKSGYVMALKAIEVEAASKERSFDQYDTTLTLAVLINDTLYYGHSGDGGIIALAVDGCYMQVTQQQQDSSGRVYPLFFKDRWEFGVYEKKVSAVLLATDGMYEPFFPIYIKNNEVNIHVQLAQSFLDHKKLDLENLGKEAAQERMSSYMDGISHEQVSDDKTIVVLINTAVKTYDRPESYYTPPNWEELKRRHEEEWKRSAYPDMYKKQEEKKAKNSAFEESLPQDMAFGAVQEKQCNACGANIPMKSTFCKKCGTKYEITIPAQTEPVYIEARSVKEGYKHAFYMMMVINILLIIVVIIFLVLWPQPDSNSENVNGTIYEIEYDE